MEVKLFETNKKQVYELDNFLKNKRKVTPRTLNELMKPINVSFSVENSSRLLSHIICESYDSYTQQSQRYVAMGDGAFIIPQELQDSEFETEYKEIIGRVFSFYNDITKEKEGEKRGRGAGKDNYEFGIPIEDGRYILPLATTTNVFTTMGGDKVLDFITLMFEQPQEEAHDLGVELIDKFEGIHLQNVLENLSLSGISDKDMVYSMHRPTLDQIDKDIVLFDRFKNPIHRVALGGVASTNARPPSEIYAKWDDPDAKAETISSKVLGYGHESVAEHARATFGTEQSLTSYHQYERHRLKSDYREPFEVIPINRGIWVPPNVEESSRLNEFMEMVDEVKIFREDLINAGYESAASYLLLNADSVKVLTSSNSRNDKLVLEQRTCNNAQWEIRDRAQGLINLLHEGMPYVYDRAGPPCTKGKCPEGDLTCGDTVAMRDKFGYFKQ